MAKNKIELLGNKATTLSVRINIWTQCNFKKNVFWYKFN